MISLQQYIYEQQNLNLIDESLYSSYVSVFNKIDIYNRNTKLINEGYTKLHNNILYTAKERQVINLFLENYMNDVICSYVVGIDEKLSLDGAKKFVTGGKEKVKELINKFVDIIPKEVIEAYELIIKAIKNGIKTAEDLINTIGKLLAKLGENIVEALDKLRLFNDEFCSKLPDSNSEILGKIVDIKNDNQKKLVSYIISNVKDGVQNKKEDVNESKEKVAAAALAGTALFSPGIAILAGGGFGLYKLLKYVGPKLSEKFEPYLLSDKTKEFANDLYNNKFARYGLNLKKEETNDDESKLHKLGRILWSIMVNLVISFLITVSIKLFVGTIITTGPFFALIVASIIGTRNIAKIVLNRILNFKKETVKKNGDIKINYFFDVVTMVGILSSIISVVIQIPGFMEWIKKVFDKMFDTNLLSSASAATNNNKSSLENIIKELKNSKDNHGGQSITSKSFEKIKSMLKDINESRPPKYGSRDEVLSFTELTQKDDSNEKFSESLKDFILTLSKTKAVQKLAGGEELSLYSSAAEVDKDGYISEIVQSFEIDANGECKRELIRFVALQDNTNNIGLNADINGKIISVIFNNAGKVIKGSKELVGKSYDDIMEMINGK